MRLRAGRLGGGAVFHVLLPLLAAGIGRVTGAAWLYVLAALFAVTVVAAVVQAVLGAALTDVTVVRNPSLVIAGRPVRITVASRSPSTIAVTLFDRGTEVAAWWHGRGRVQATVPVRFAARGAVGSLAVEARCSSTIGLWPVVCRREVPLDGPVLVGPAPLPAAAPSPTGAAAVEGSAGQSRHGEIGDVYGVRPWTDGDPVGWVHWPTTLRTGELSVLEWAPPRRPTVTVTATPGPDGDRAAALAAGQVASALAAGDDVHLAIPDGTHWDLAPVADDLSAAARLAAARLGPVAPVQPATPIEPDRIEDRLPPRVAVAAAVGLGAGAVLAGLHWPPVTSAAVVIGAPLGLLLSWRFRRRQPPMVALGSAIAALAAIVRFAVALASAPANLHSVGDPLGELVVVMVVIHGLDQPSRRNLRFALGASAMLLVYAAAFRIDGTFGWWVLAWLAATVASLAALARSEAGQLRLRPPGGRRRAASMVGRSLVVAAAGAATTVGVLGLIPVPEGPVRLLYPSSMPVRLPIPRPGGLAAPDAASGGGTGGGGSGSDSAEAAGRGTTGYFAFEEQFDTSSRGRPDRTVVMRVRAPAADFWRGQAFERWDGRRWAVDADQGAFRTGPVVAVGRPAGEGPGRPIGDRLVQTFTIEQPMPNLLFAAWRAERVYVDAGVWVRPDGALRADTTLQPGSVYTVVSQRAPITESLLRLQGGPSSGPMQAGWQTAAQRYTQLPPSTSQRTRALAEELTGPFPAVSDKVRAIEAWMAQNVQYDLDAPVPPDGTDAVDHFLFQSKRGFCEQIATAMAVMLRSVGVPARLAAGYTPGHWDAFAGVWVVRASDAHAWIEVPFPATGWQAFDPTASVPLAGDSATRRSIGGPIATAIAGAVRSAAPLLGGLAVVGGAGWLAARFGRRRRQAGDRPAAPAQRRFERLARQAGIDIADSDTNPAVAARLAATRGPAVGIAARTAAEELDRAAFGHGSPAAANAAVAALATAVNA